MATVAGRKKSIVSSAGIQIDTPVAHNTLLNKAASQSTSLYQQCSQLRSRLMRIRGFDYYFSLISTDARRSTDPVSHLWDLFSLGIPLCFLFDLLPTEKGYPKINNSQFNEEEFDQNPDKPKKRAIAHFAMQVRTDRVSQTIPGCEPFTVTDLWDRNSTDGLVKVVHTVTAIVNHLPEDVFDLHANDSTDSFDAPELAVPGAPANAQESARNNITREIVETERKYVQDLEVMQKYANALAQGGIIDQDTIHLLFPNLNKLLNFQRKFLIRLESIAEQPWQQQRWGQPFLETEDEFVVYEPYCANYTSASDLMLANEQNLSALNHLINVKGELPAFLIKPIQRVCKYPLLLDSLIKATSTAGYQHFDELKAGSDAAKRITDKINEAQRRAENELTVENLRSRIDDWKGHHLENFGDLLLDDIFVVTKSDIDREYHVFLFEKIILCCKEVLMNPQNGRVKNGKSNSILKKQLAPPPLTLPGGAGSSAKKTTPLLLKGRIFLGNVTQAVPVPSKPSTNPAFPTQYPLAVWWKGDDDLEYFTLRCKREDQMRQWEAAINRLIKEAAQRRAHERNNGLSRLASASSAGFPPRYASKISQSSYGSSTPGQTYSMYSTQSSMSSATSSRGPPTPYGSDLPDGFLPGQKTSVYSSGPAGYPPHDGFEFEQDEDEYEDYPPSSTGSAYAPSGRGTPVAYRRDNAVSLPPERHAMPNPHESRPRAQTEDTNGPVMQQWRRDIPNTPSPQLGPMPGPQSAYPHGAQPQYNRMNSTSSAYSYASNESFGNGIGGPKSRPPLRSQFSSTRLRTNYEQNEGPYPHGAENQASKGSMPTMVNANGQPIATRARSASSPMAYVPKPSAPPPPVPVPGVPTWSRERNGPTSTKDKRGSGSSQSTGGDSSDYSPNSGSPVTPFGSSESSLAGVGIRAHYLEGSPISKGNELPVKVKVHFHEDIFVIQVAMSTEYEDLVEKVGKKIRLCGPRRDDGPLRVKYRDEDGDMVTLSSTEDVQIAFEQYRPGSQVTLFVT